MRSAAIAAIVCLATVSPILAQDYNIKVITDASPDFSDMDSMVRSITAKWPTMRQRCWAMWYWVHLARRQTPPQVVHGNELSDPIRQFNDYGYSMCSTMAGVNNAIWNQMGMKVRFRDIHLHTVSECYYDNRWHVYDNSLSTIYTLCDGKTIAGVDDVGKEGACELSGGKVEVGHLAKYHCLASTSRNGFLTGGDGARSLKSEYECFRAPGLQYNWFSCGYETGHRYILNLRDNEAYTRYYVRFDRDKDKFDEEGKKRVNPEAAGYYVPTVNPGKNRGEPKDPERGVNLRGNGLWVFKPSLAADQYKKAIWAEKNIVAAGGYLQPAKAGESASATYRINSANVTTSMTISADILRKRADDSVAASISTDNGLHWQEIFKAEDTGTFNATVDLIKEVNGQYQTLIRFDMLAGNDPAGAALMGLEVRTITQVNSKAMPRLNIGKNVIYVDAGEQADSIVFYPDNSTEAYKLHVCDEKNIGQDNSMGAYHGPIHPLNRSKEAFVTYRVDAPGEITSVNIGGRFENRAKDNHVDLLWSVDGGKTWKLAWSLTDFSKPYDTLHHELVQIPAGNKTVWVKYFMTKGSCVRSNIIEAHVKPAAAEFKPLEVTWTWDERQADRSLVRRSHTQLVEKVPCRYEINVGGEDHPVMVSTQTRLAGSSVAANAQPANKLAAVKYGYSDGKDSAGAKKFIYQWQTVGTNYAQGKRYTTSVASEKWKDSAGPGSRKLTDGIVASSFACDKDRPYGETWESQAEPFDIDVDLDQPCKCGAFRIQLGNCWPKTDSLVQGDNEDKVELLTSADGKKWSSQGFFNLNLWYKDLPINYILPDSEKLEGYNYELLLPKPVECRLVRWRVSAPKHVVLITEVQALDFIRYEPFDIRLTLPDEKVERAKIDPATLTPPSIDLEEQKLWPSDKPAAKPAASQPSVPSKPRVKIKHIASQGAEAKP